MASSRMRINTPNIYDAFYLFEHVTDASGSNINMVRKYPSDIDDNASIEAVKKFCFPKSDTNWSSSDPVSFFTFTLTDGQGLFTFGHCRFSPSKSLCMCILSALPDIAFFKYTLGYLAIAQPPEVDKCLQYLYHTAMPSGEQMIRFPDLVFSSSLRDFNTHVSSFNEMEVVMLFNSIHITTNQIIYLYASMLKERRIVITASRLETLTNCTYGALKLLYPFHWQNLFIPILPSDLVDQLMAPMPYIIGVPKETLQATDMSQYGDIVLLDIDEQLFQSDTEDLLPPPIFKYLAKQLKTKDTSSIMNPDILIRAFMKATVIIFGRYRSGLCKADSEQNSKITWDRQRFISAQPTELKAFAQALVCEDGVQYFERFIDEKLEALNNGVGSNEEFDRMLRNVDEYYQEALDAGRNFKESVQDAVQGVKNNTNAMFGSIKGTVQQVLKKKPFTPRVGRKKKPVPVTPYSFAPPTLPSPEKDVLTPTETQRMSPDVHLMIFNDDDDFISTSSGFVNNSRPASINSQNCSGSTSEIASTSSLNSSNPFLRLLPDLSTGTSGISSTNPFLPKTPDSTVAASRENWEKFD